MSKIHYQFLPFCRSVTSNLGTAILLDYFIRFSFKSKLKKDGDTWIATTREDACKHTQLSVNQYNLAIRRLREAGWIETEIHPHPTKPRLLRATWIHLADKFCDLLDEEMTRQDNA
jgi:hypothetical protein